MMNIICYAPTAMSEWYSNRNMNKFGKHELRLPLSNNEENKAVFCVEVGRYLSSFTVWGQGTTEWIVVDGISGDTVVVEDSQFTDVAQLYLLIDEAIKKLGILAT